MADNENNEPTLSLDDERAAPSAAVIVLDEKRKERARVPRLQRIVPEALEIVGEPIKDEIAYLSSIMVLATFPYREPKGIPAAFFRQAGKATLYIQPLMKNDPKDPSKMVTCYPYGLKPRLLMAYLGKEIQAAVA